MGWKSGQEVLAIKIANPARDLASLKHPGSLPSAAAVAGPVWEDQGTLCGQTDSKLLDGSGLITQAASWVISKKHG